MIKKNLVILSMLLAVAASSSAKELTLPEAVAAQEALAEETPTDARLFNDLGNLLLLVGRTEEAEGAYRRAIELDPELVSARFNLGLFLQQTQRPNKAQREFRKVLKIDSDHAWSHYQLGVLNARLGKRNLAIKRYALALRLDSRLTDPAYNPHILDNPLAASATLRAYADLSSADLVPRTYEAPRRIAGMLVPLPSEKAVKPKRKKAKKAKKARKKKAQEMPTGETSAPVVDEKPVPKPPVRPVPKRKPKPS